MNDIIIYRPYKTPTRFLALTVPASVFAFVGVGYCLPRFSEVLDVTILFTIIGIWGLWLTKVLYDVSKNAVFFEPNGLRVYGCNYTDHRYMPWDNIEYGYYSRNYKGNLFLVLSSDALCPKDIKRFVNRGAISLLRMGIGNVVVIFLDPCQDVSQIKKQISNRIAHIETY